MELKGTSTMRLLALLALAVCFGAHQAGSRNARLEPQATDHDYGMTMPQASFATGPSATPQVHLAGSLNSSHRTSALALYYNASSAIAQQRRPHLSLKDPTHKLNQQQQQQQQHRHQEPEQENTLTRVALIKSLLKQRYAHDGELPLIASSFNSEDKKHLAAAHLAFYEHSLLPKSLSIAEILRMALIAVTESAVYHHQYLHRYDNYDDMRRASGPAVDDDKCIEQLTHLAGRAANQTREKYYSRDSNLYGLLDTWGHPGSGVFMGRLFMEGSYSECVRYKIRFPPSEEERARGQIMSSQAPIGTRYCVLSVRHRDWQRADKHDVLNLKISVCIPKACDSRNFRNKFQLIGQIAQSQARGMEQNEFRITGMYCLPDEDSPLRSIRSSPRALAALTFFCAWALLLIYATHRYSKLKKIVHKANPQADGDVAPTARLFGLSNASIATRGAPEESAGDTQATANPLASYRTQLEVFKLLSITNNLKLLFDTTKESALLGAAASKKTGPGKSGEEKEDAVAVAARQEVAAMKFVDLRCIEGIKVIAMVYVILGHVVMCLPAIIINGRDLSSPSSYAFFLANLVPAFAVNCFFTITGILTCYLLFKQNKSQPVIRSPGKWAAFIFYRYLRIMPMYALAVLYCKTLAKYTGSGPFWDYGTTALSQRATCEQEPWHWTLLFTSNFLPPMQHCIPGGWYLSNDFQFFLATPLLLMALERSPKWGKALLKTLVVAGFSLGFHSIYASEVDDLRPIAMLSPHGFKTYVSHFSANYTRPQYRIPAYLIGLLVGYKLFEYEEEKKHFHKTALQRRLQSKQLESHPEMGLQEAESAGAPPDWSVSFKSRAAFWSAFLFILSAQVPLIGMNLRPTKWAARVLVALITPLCHVMISTAAGLYIMLATTGNGNKYITRFLSASWWKPLARLSLCAVLVNVEVINYMIQTDTSQQRISNQYLMMFNILSVLTTYLVATVLCVLFEAPIRASLNAILTNIISRFAAGKQKTH